MTQPKQAPRDPATAVPKKRAAPRKVPRAEAEKAVAEIKNPAKPRIGSFRGIELTLPPTLPASFAFDCMEIGEGDGSTLTDMRALVVGLVGADAWKLVLDKIRADGDPIESVDPILEELIDSVTAPYGMNLGESPASATA